MTSGFLASGVTRPDPGAGAGGAEPVISLRRPALLGTAATTVVVGGAIVGGRAFVSVLPGAWFFGSAGGPLGSFATQGRTPSAVALLLVFGGLIVLTRTWLGLLRLLGRHPGVPVRRIVAVLALWVVPLVVAPPLFSRDLYSYAGQGEMVSHHIDPYQYGTGVLGSTPFSSLPGPLWSNSPSPYGPVFLAADGAIATAVDHHELADLVLLRLLELAGLALVIGGLPTLARGWGRDPAEVVLLGAGSPLVLTTLVGGGHNDALMVGLMVAGLAVARRFGPVPGIVLCALATGVKAPALLAIVVIGWNWAPAGASFVRRGARTLGALGIGAATLAVVSAVTGVGWGWVRNLGTANQIWTGVTPVSAVAHVLAGTAGLAGIPLPFSSARTVLDVVGLLCAIGICACLLVRSPRVGPLRSLGLMLLVLSILSPILWAWYLTWGLVILAVVATGRLRRTVVAVTVAWTFIGVSSVEGITHAVWHAGAPAAVLLLVGLVGVALVPLGLPAGTAADDPVAAGTAAGDLPASGSPRRTPEDGRDQRGRGWPALDAARGGSDPGGLTARV